MRFRELFDTWGLNAIRLNLRFAEMEFAPADGDREAAWEMYVELITRITTQPLPDNTGDEETALTSIYSLFGATRQILKSKGRNAQEFTKVSVIILNQVIRPFTAKWHREKLAKAFENPEKCAEFRTELADLQERLCKYSALLADMAKVEDITQIEAEPDDSKLKKKKKK